MPVALLGTRNRAHLFALFSPLFLSKMMRFTRDGAVGNMQSDKSRRVLSCILFLCFLGLGALIAFATIPFSVLDGRSDKKQSDLVRIAVDETNWWSENMRLRVIESAAAARAIEGFVIGEIDNMPPWKGGLEQRALGWSFERFPYVAAAMFRNVRNNTGTVVMLAPGGVVSQTFPNTESVLEYDFFESGNGIGVAAAERMAERGGFELFGPVLRRVPVPNASWQLLICSAIHNATSGDPVSVANFWGFTVVVKDLMGLLDVGAFEERMKELEMNYLVYITDDANNTIPVTTSLRNNLTTAEIEKFTGGCYNRPVLPQVGHLFMCVRSAAMIEKHSRSTVVLLVVGCVFISLIAFVCGVMVVLPCLREFDSRMNAPKTVPFVMTIVGPCNAERLFELAPSAAFPVLEKYAKLQKAVITNNHGYVGLQVHPYTATFVTRDVDTAIETCFQLLKGVQKKHLDEPLKKWLGADGELSIAAAIHWCADAYIRVETVNGSIRYEGNDVKYCERMWMFVPPNKVTISQHAKDNIRSPSTEVCTTQIGSVFFRGVKEKQALFNVTRVDGDELQTFKDSTVPPSRIFGSAEIEQAEYEETPNAGFIPISIQTNTRGTGGCEMPPSSPNLHKKKFKDRASQYCCSRDQEEHGTHRNPLAFPGGGDEVLPRTVAFASDPDNGRVGAEDVEIGLKFIYPRDHHVNPHIPTGSRFRLANDDVTHGYAAASSDKNVSKATSSGNSPVTDFHTMDELACVSVTSKGDFITEALMRPWIPNALNTHFRVLFEQYSLFLDFSYESVRTVIFYFYIAYKELLKPLAGPERTNLFNRFVIAFGVPPQSVLEALAVRCALRHIQQLEGIRTMLWHSEQERLQPSQCANAEDTKREGVSHVVEGRI